MNTDWAKVLKRALSGEPDKVPKGWKTTEQICAEVDRAPRTVRQCLIAGVKSGTIEVKRFRIQCGSRVVPVNHYREVKGK